MVNQTPRKKFILIFHILRGAIPLTYLFLLIEFFDELNYGIGNAALPAIRADLGISYVQVGMLLGLPAIINTVIEPVLMLLGDTRYRKQFILAGGIVIVLSLVSIASTQSFAVVLLGMIIGYPASGAFVSLSQATLMDLNPGREPQMMARWTVSGSVANLIGPLLLAAGICPGVWMALGIFWHGIPVFDFGGSHLVKAISASFRNGACISIFQPMEYPVIRILGCSTQSQPDALVGLAPVFGPLTRCANRLPAVVFYRCDWYDHHPGKLDDERFNAGWVDLEYCAYPYA